MGSAAVGDVVVVNFPFSDPSGHRLRPALVLAKSGPQNLILCQITSRPYASQRAVAIRSEDFILGALPISSYVRPDKLFTTGPSIIKRTVGKLKPTTRTKIVSRVRALFI